MSITSIPKSTIYVLWGKAAGCCEYDGCNKVLWRDSVTKAEFNIAYTAHIIADQPGGPRGDPILSAKLKADLSNLMLLCDEHHRLIDHEQVDEHPIDRLRKMKEKHEQRIEFLVSLTEKKQSHVVLYGASIGEHSAPVSWKRTVPALFPHRYPAESHAIEIGLQNSSFTDDEPSYWEIEQENLRRLFNQKVKSRLAVGEISHLSVFALAPQPLLIKLGSLLSDLYPADVYQLHREPSDWKWQPEPEQFEYLITEPKTTSPLVALNLSLSATIDSCRIEPIFNGQEYSEWQMTITNPNNDYLRSQMQLQLFRQEFRQLLNRIKARHGEKAVIHLFPAVPASVAVEIGRVRQPKADLPFEIYDQNKSKGFLHTFMIGDEKNG